MKRNLFRSALMLSLLFLIAPLFAAGGGEGFHEPTIGYLLMDALWRGINGFIFFGTLFLLLRKPVGDFFSGRVQKISDSLELAEKSREDAKSRLDEIEAKMAKLDQELADIERQAKAEAEREKQRIEAEAKQEAERIVALAKAEVENMHQEALLELRAYVADLALAQAEETIKNSATAKDHDNLIVQFTSRLGVSS